MRVPDVGDRTPTVPSVPAAPPVRPVVVQASDVVVTYRLRTSPARATLKAALVGATASRGTRDVQAVRGVSFDVREGEAVGLIGPNGSGKSTLLRAVAGLLKVTSGQVLVRSPPVLLGVGAALEPELSGARNVILGGTALGMSKQEVLDAFDDIVDFAGVREAIDRPLKTYSSGMAARLRFAIASALQPDVLLIDEALSVGDAEFRERSRQRMQQMIEQAGALFFVSHSLGQVEDICTRAMWLDRGLVRMDGAVKEVIAAYRSSV
jgi:teichoic acid transport system ATP-binding protein